jgi:hypothetical protein
MTSSGFSPINTKKSNIPPVVFNDRAGYGRSVYSMKKFKDCLLKVLLKNSFPFMYQLLQIFTLCFLKRKIYGIKSLRISASKLKNSLIIYSVNNF